jgi:hypothetical protein
VADDRVSSSAPNRASRIRSARASSRALRRRSASWRLAITRPRATPAILRMPEISAGPGPAATRIEGAQDASLIDAD